MRYTTEAVTGRPSFWANAARSGDTTSMPPSADTLAQGCRKLRSCSMLIAARRRPPHLGAGWEGCATRLRKRAWYLATVARPIPSTAAVCSSVESNSPGSNTACAQRSSSTVWASNASACACATNPMSTRRGLAMPFSRRHRRPRACHSSSHLESELE